MPSHIYLSAPHMSDEGYEMAYIQDAFSKNWISPMGENVNEFENAVRDYLKVDHVVALSSGTASIHMALIMAGVRQGDMVFCQDFTFAASANPITYLGAEPVFIDSEYETWNMDPKALRKAFEKYPECKCVIVVNLYGVPAKLDEIRSICDEHGAVLIEDAAESLSATYKGVQTGTFGKYNAISFNGNKIITTSGGGMLLSDDEEAIKKARFWSTQSRDPAPWYQHSETGYNYRMSNIVAGIGRGQLLHLDEHKELKRKIYNRYKEAFKDLPVSMNPYLECSDPNFWLSCILIDKGCKVQFMDIVNALAEENIEARPIWKPMHMHPLFEGYDFISANENSVGEDIFSRGVCLPSDIKMTDEEQEKVIEIIKNLF